MAANSKINIVVEATDKASKTLQSIGGSVLKIGTIAGGAALAGVAALGAGMVKLASDAEPALNIQKSFEGLAASVTGGSDAMLKALQEGSRGFITNTDLMQSYNKAAQLVSQDFANTLPDAMNYLGKVSAATGDDMGFLLNSLTTGIGRLSPMILDNLAIQVDLTQANEDYAKQIGKNVSELTKQEQQAALTAQVMQKLAENTANLPDPTGGFQNFNIALQNLKDTIGKALVPAMTPFIQLLTDLMSRIGPKVESFVTDRLVPALKTIAGVAQQVIAAFQFGGIADGFTALVTRIVSFIPGLNLTEDQFEKISETVYDLFHKTIPQAIDTIKEFIGPIAQWIAKTITLKDVLIALAVVIVATLIPAAVALAASLIEFVAPILAIVAIVALLRTAWENNWGGIQEKTQAVIEFIRGIIDGALTWIRAFWAENGDAIMAKAQEIWGGIQAFISGAVTATGGVISTVLAAIKTFWDQHGEQIMAIANKVWGYIKTIIEFDIAGIKLIVTTVLSAISAFWDAHGVAIIAAAQSAWETIKTIISTVIEIIQTVYYAFRSAFEGDWRAFGEQLRQAWEQAWNLIGEVVTNIGRFILNAIAQLVLNIIAKFQNVDWGGVGHNIIQGIANGITAAAGLIKDAAINAAKAAWEAAKGFFGIESPSKLMFAMGENVSKGLALGISAQQKMVTDAISGLMSQPLQLNTAPMSAGISGGGQTTNTNYYNMTVNTSAQSSTVIDDFRLMQAQAGR